MPRRYTYGVDIDDSASSTAARMAANLKREFGKIQGDLDETGSDAQKLARVIDRMADDTAAELARIERAADRLGQALGPEMADRVDTTAAVMELNKMGASFEDIEANVDELAASITKLDGAVGKAGPSMRGSLNSVDDGLRKVSESGDQSRSVLANMAGNATSELPGIGTALGPVNVALGQMAEYAADGNIKLRSLVGLGAGMAALGVGISAVSSHFERIARADAFSDDKVAAWVDGMREGKSLTEAIADNYERAGKVEVEVGNQVIDLTSDLADLGLTVDQFATLTTMSQEGVQEWAAKMREAGVDGEALNLVLVALGSEADDVARAEEGAAVNAEVFGEAQRRSAESIAETNRMLEENRQRLEEAAAAERDLADAVLANADVALQYRDAERQRITAVEDAMVTQDEATTGINETEAAWDRAEQAAHRQVAASVAAAEVWNGGALTAQQAVEVQIRELQRIIDGLHPHAPLRANLQGYIDQLRQTQGTFRSSLELTMTTRGAVNPDGSRGTPVRAAGGPTWAGQEFEVTEGGKPELYQEGGKTYLLPGGNGQVTPLTGGQVGSAGAASMPPIVVQLVLDGRQIDESLVRLKRANGGLGFEKS